MGDSGSVRFFKLWESLGSSETQRLGNQTWLAVWKSLQKQRLWPGKPTESGPETLRYADAPVGGLLGA